jgi:gas vesicle protein
MEQDITKMNDLGNQPDNLPHDKEERDSAELAADQLLADLLKEQATGPFSAGLVTPNQGEDVVLLVETGMLPDEAADLSMEDSLLAKIGQAEIDQAARSPWYRSQWFYLGSGLVGGAALAAGAVLLLRSRRTRQRSVDIGRTQPLLNRWSRQLGWQASMITERAGKLSSQAQGQINRLAGRTPGGARNLLLLQRQRGSSAWLKQMQRQLTNLSQQARNQASAIGNSIGATTRATTAQTIDRTQASLAQVRQGVASGAARTGKGLKSGWKFSRNFTVGMAAGALWAALFAPESGEATRQRLTTIFQLRRIRNR